MLRILPPELRVLAIPIMRCRGSNPAAPTGQSESNAYGIGSRSICPANSRAPVLGFIARATHSLADIDNSAPTTAPTMYMAQAERLIGVLVDVNMKYSPRSAIPKLPAIASFIA
jgi:hypothetical protein